MHSVIIRICVNVISFIIFFFINPALYILPSYYSFALVFLITEPFFFAGISFQNDSGSQCDDNNYQNDD